MADNGILIREKTGSGTSASLRKRFCLCSALTALLSAAALLLIPAARNSAKVLCNRIFAASESANAYLYDYFAVPDGQTALTAEILAALTVLGLTVLAVLLRDGRYSLFCMLLFCIPQIYFGLALPVWLNVLIGGLLGMTLLRPNGSFIPPAVYAGIILICAALTAVFFPGVDPQLESSSETVRDLLGRAAIQISGDARDLPQELLGTRHLNSRTLLNGGGAAAADRTFRLRTVEEEQISRPDFAAVIDLLLIILPAAALAAGAGILLYRLAVRRKRLAEIRHSFESENTAEAVCAVFRHAVRYLECAGCGSGNLPFRDWGEALRSSPGADYAALFEACVPVFEEACYSEHRMDRSGLDRVKKLLDLTEVIFFDRADLKQKFRLKFVECLHQ